MRAEAATVRKGNVLRKAEGGQRMTALGNFHGDFHSVWPGESKACGHSESLKSEPVAEHNTELPPAGHSKRKYSPLQPQI